MSRAWTTEAALEDWRQGPVAANQIKWLKILGVVAEPRTRGEANDFIRNETAKTCPAYGQLIKGKSNKGLPA